MKNIVKPFLKWAGGKTQLLKQIEQYCPEKLKNGQFKKYVEPFVGGGAMFFYLIQKYVFDEVYLNDINKDVILAYKVIQMNHIELINELTIIEDQYLSLNNQIEKEKFFYETRKQFNVEKQLVDYETYSYDWIFHVSKLIFLNKTCFNGLYRVNKKGLFNVPFGKYENPNICNFKNIENVNTTLKNVNLSNDDFENLTNIVDEKSFVYMDPPYKPLSKTSNFIGYSDKKFDDDEQARLAKWYSLLDSKKASLLLSNSDHDDFFCLYKNFHIHKIQANRAINSKSSKRGKINELLVSNQI